MASIRTQGAIASGMWERNSAAGDRQAPHILTYFSRPSVNARATIVIKPTF